MAITFIHTADLHLRDDEPFRMEVLTWIVAHCRRISAHLIIAGDFFDSDVESSFLRPRVREIIKDVPGCVVLIAGNHDANSYGADVDYGGNAVILRPDSPYADIDGIRIMGVPFVPGVEFSHQLHRVAGPETVDILIAHGTFYDRRSSAVYVELGEDAQYMPIYPWDVEGKARYVALGHYHSRYACFTAGTTQIVYPGSPVATSARCAGPRYIGVATFEDDDVRYHEELVVIADYWEQREWIVVPGREDQLFVLLEEDLDRLAGSRVMLHGRVIGSVRVSEVEFASCLRALEEKHRGGYKSLRLISRARYWDELLRNPTLRLFTQRLIDTNADDPTKERALELVLAAIERIRT